MATIEEEYVRLRRGIKFYTDFALLFKKFDIRGADNFVLEGPNIIVGNHIGSYKDVALLLQIVPRRIFFTANKMIFDRDDLSQLVLRHLKRHLKEFGSVLHMMMSPFFALSVQYVSSNIASIGTIPVAIDGHKSPSIIKCQDYLKQGRAIIALQGRGRVYPKDPDPYVKEFRRGVSIMALNLEKEGLSVPITPISIFGTHYPWGVPARIRVNVGEPIYIRDHVKGDDDATIDAFRVGLHRRIEGLLIESLGW